MTARCSKCRGDMLPEWAPFLCCPTCRESEAERLRAMSRRPGYYAKRYADRDAKGVCTHCGRARDRSPAKLCAKCHADNTDRLDRARFERSEAGLCLRGEHPRDDEFATCSACRAQVRAWSAKRREIARAA